MKAVMYHYIEEENPAFPHFRYLHVDDFRQQLDYFEREFGFIRREDFEGALAGGPLPKGILLTFDDALSDHMRFVYPELERRGLFGFFYAPTYPYTTQKLLGVHRVHALIGKAGGRAIAEALSKLIEPSMLDTEHLEEFKNMTYPNQPDDVYTQEVKRTLNYYIAYEHREAVLDRLMDMFFDDEAALVASYYLKPEELRTLHDGGMIVGAHSVNHFLMSKLSREEQAREIRESFAFLENLMPLTQKSFCLPYGGSASYTEETVELLEAEGCDFTFDVNARDIVKDDFAPNRRQLLPRYDCNMFPFGKVRDLVKKGLY